MKAAAERPQHQPEGRRRLALAGARMDDEKPLLDGLRGDLPVLDLLALDHLGAVARVFVLDSFETCLRVRGLHHEQARGRFQGRVLRHGQA